jgi:hypothetical protein
MASAAVKHVFRAGSAFPISGMAAATISLARTLMPDIG